MGHYAVNDDSLDDVRLPSDDANDDLLTELVNPEARTKSRTNRPSLPPKIQVSSGLLGRPQRDSNPATCVERCEAAEDGVRSALETAHSSTAMNADERAEVRDRVRLDRVGRGSAAGVEGRSGETGGGAGERAEARVALRRALVAAVGLAAEAAELAAARAVLSVIEDIDREDAKVIELARRGRGG